MIGDLNRLVLAENFLGKSALVGALVNLNSVPLKATDFPTASNDIVCTCFRGQVKYFPNMFGVEKPYVLRCDLFGSRNYVRFVDMKELREMSKTDKVVEFILKWSDLDEEFLEAVKEVPGAHLYVPFKIKEYRRYLKKNYKGEVGKFIFTTEVLSNMESVRTESFIQTRRERDKERKRRNK